MIESVVLLSISTSMLRPTLAMLSHHYKCRSEVYPRSNVMRYPVPDDKVTWSSNYECYNPPKYTASFVFGKPWADPEIDDINFKPKWNNIDGNVSRISHTGQYIIVNGYPLNPVGRTGIVGRGVLGKWGPNHAADPVVTRWKKLPSGDIKLDKNKRPILQFVAIKRGDTGEWALPGGMVDPGEKVTNTSVREFQEEAMNSLTMTEDQKEKWKKKFQEFFSKGQEIYKGYVDDPRNTDNSWMETVAYNFHDENGSVVGDLNLQAGDDAVGVKWVDIKDDIKLYASHLEIIKVVLNQLVNNK